MFNIDVGFSIGARTLAGVLVFGGLGLVSSIVYESYGVDALIYIAWTLLGVLALAGCCGVVWLIRNVFRAVSESRRR